MRPITLKQAKNLVVGQIVYHTYNKNADGSPQQWKVNGQVKTWKQNPKRVQVPLKYGGYMFGHLTEDILKSISLTDK